MPTFAEQGFASVTATGWNASFAPAKTPPAVIDRLEVAVAADMRRWRRELDAMGFKAD